MRPSARFQLDGELLQAPEERFLPSSGKSVFEILVQVGGYNGKSPNIFRCRVHDGRDVQGLRPRQRVRVEGPIFSTQGQKQIFYDFYADSVLPFAGEPSRLSGYGSYGREVRA